MKKGYLNYIICVLLAIIIGILLYLTLYDDKVKIEDIALNKDRIELYVGENERLVASVIPEDSTNYELEWTSDNPQVANVYSGIVVASSEGRATITVSIKDQDKKGTCEVVVVPVPTPVPTIEPTPIPTPTVISVSDITLDKTSIIMANGAKDTLSATILPNDATNKEFTWTSSDNNVITVTDGKIVANGVGNATVKAISVDGNKEASCEIKVVAKKTFDQRNDAIIEYFKEPSSKQIMSLYKSYKCNKSSCTKPKIYNPSFNDNINVYEYKMSDNSKKLITSTNTSFLNYYLIPGNTYYLESASDKNNVNVVSITGKLRVPNVDGLNNLRDLGGWNADGGIVKYGKLFRSERPDGIKSLNQINALGIKSVVDLRKKSEVSNNSPVKNIRTIVTVYNYSTDKSAHSRDAVLEIMKRVVSNQPVLFHCQIGRDRTGTVAYLLEGILGVPQSERDIDYELSYFAIGARTRTFSNYINLGNKVNKFSMTQYEQERFINWFISSSTNKEQDLNLINNFRKTMINGNPHTYKLVNGVLTIQ